MDNPSLSGALGRPNPARAAECGSQSLLLFVAFPPGLFLSGRPWPEFKLEQPKFEEPPGLYVF